MTLRLALVGNWPRPYGGVAVHVAALTRAARAAGLDVRVLDIGRGDHRADGIRPARGPLRYTVALAGAAAEGRLVHVHTSGANPKSWLLALAASRARLPGAPRGVLTLHSGATPAWLRARAWRRRLAAAGCAGFGRVIAVSPEIAATLAACGVPEERLTVLPAWSPTLLEAPEPPAALAAFRAAHAPVLAALLAPGAVYGADLLLPALAALRAAGFPRAGLVAFGAGTERLAQPGVLGLGEIPHAGVLGAIGMCDVFVRPTRADGDAVTVREALALGCAVVASDVGHRPAGCLLFDAGDAAALRGRLEEAARAGRPGARLQPGEDPLDEILALYRTLRAEATPRLGRALGAP